MDRKWKRRRLPLALVLLALGAWTWWTVRQGSQEVIEASEARILRANPAAYAFHQTGESDFARGALPEAAADFRRAGQLEGRSALALLNLGMVESSLGHRKESLSALLHAAEIEPNWSRTWQTLAGVYADDNQLRKAEDAAHRAVDLSPRSTDAWLMRAHVALLEANFTDAELASRRVLALAPDRPEAWLSLGDVLLRVPGKGRLPEAIAAFQHAVALSPSPYALGQLAEGQRRALQFPDALRSLREALRLAPRDASLAFQLSTLLQTIGNVEEGKEWAAQARQFQDERYRLASLQNKAHQTPGDAGVQEQLAHALELQGSRTEAMQAYNRVLALQPENEKARQALARLEVGPAAQGAEGD